MLYSLPLGGSPSFAPSLSQPCNSRDTSGATLFLTPEPRKPFYNKNLGEVLQG